ncbi:MAG: gluconeogenesis factor YvcK family protein [Acidimicrobiales bacterium]
MTDGNAPRVVAAGGGHGLAVTIRAVRQYAGHATAVVSAADDGGSTGRLRSSMALPAPGDLRRCLAAMAGIEDHPLGQALEYRFGGTDVEGHALGNLVLAGLAAVTGDFLAATDEMGRLLGVDPSRGRVVPATAEPVVLRATTATGRVVSGQVAVSGTEGIRRVELDPPGVKPPDGVVGAVLDAEQVVLGPGSLFTSVLAAVVVDDLRRALATTSAQRVYVCNLRAQAAETRGYDVARHVAALRDHGVQPDVVLVQVNGPLDLGKVDAEVAVADVARPHGRAHDSDRLAVALAALL